MNGQRAGRPLPRPRLRIASIKARVSGCSPNDRLRYRIRLDKTLNPVGSWSLRRSRAALREPDLPKESLSGPTLEIKLLLSHREDLVAESTRIHNRLRWHLTTSIARSRSPPGAFP